ncbi:MAG: AMP-binding protein [Pirellulales bacterium]|nr:AMP-binding protein [Pirellulales bacterium]
MTADSTSFDYAAACQAADAWAAIPPRYNLGAALTRGNVEAGRGDRVALNWENSASERRQYTYAQLDELSTRFASALATLGVSPGDRVLLRLPNLPEYYIAALGVAKLGGVFIPTSTQFHTSEVAYRLQDAGVVVAVTTTGLAAEIEASRDQAPALRHVIAYQYAGAPLSSGQLDFWQIVDSGDATFPSADTANDDLAFIAYTSGTTGDPKGVVHYQRYPISYESLIRHWHDYRDDDIVTCPAELGWLLPVASTFLYAMRCGISIVLYHSLDGRFHPPAWFELVERYGVTNFVGTPTMYRMLIADREFSQAKLGSLRHGTSAGEPLPPDTLLAIRDTLGITPLDGIGMSECMVYCFNAAGDEVVPGSCGRPAPGCDVRLMNDQLQEVAIGEEGVLCVRRSSHPGMMQEYWHKSDRTAEVFDGDWYISGDVLSRDESDRFWFKGRNDDVIKASGYRISPFEVESCLVEHPAVLEAAAVSSPDSVRGFVVKAFIVLRAGQSASPDLAADIQLWARQRMAGYKYPRKVEFVAELPKTTSGKIKRRLLREGEAG